ncbi:MAG TPA: PadR family transcriptional regulator [Candidatus Thermoplasmatota archaeon]|nr:PadR family transcriptional regulator [Candidatus Thermoplasmatota archaeon]
MAADPPDARGRLLRGLAEPLVLESIARGPKHGYALLRELEETFGVAPNRNQIYPLLARLVERGLLKAADDEAGKTTYHLTGNGLEALREYKTLPDTFRARVAELWELPPPGAAVAGIRAAAPRVGAQPAGATGTAGTSPTPDVRELLRAPAAAPLAVDLPAAPIHCKDARIRFDAWPGEGRRSLEFACDYGNLPECPTCAIFLAGEAMKRRFL